MGLAQSMLDKILQQELSTKALTRHLVRKLLKNKGVELPDDALKSVAIKFMSLLAESEEFDLPVPTKLGSVFVCKQDYDKALEELDEGLKRIPEIIGKTTSEEVTPIVLNAIRASAKNTLKARVRLKAEFERLIQKCWGKPLNKLEMLIAIAQEAQETFAQDASASFRKLRQPERESMFEALRVLVGVHIRACRTAWEAFCLLKSGYADGANARWRSLYELNIVMMFLVKHQGDLPQRYHRHSRVERWRNAQQYQLYCNDLGQPPYSEADIKGFRSEYEVEIQRYGSDFRHDYGWAAHLLGKPKVGITDLESNLQFERWKPYYKMSCHSVHAGAQGLFWSLGSEERLLPDASLRGLADPGSLTALSLTQATTAMFSFQANVDCNIVGQIMTSLCDEIGDEFLKAQRRLESPKSLRRYPSRNQLRKRAMT